MNASQKRTLKLLVLLVAALAVVLIAVTALKDRAAEKEAEAAAAASAANTVTDAEAAYTALTYSNGAATLSFALDAETAAWYWADDPEFPLDNAYLTKLLNTITGLQPQQTITEPDPLEDYGLDAPSMTLTAMDGEETALTLSLGDQVSGDSGSYYMLLNGDESTVYIVSNTLAGELSQGIYDMMLLPELPVIEEADFVSISVQGAAETTLTAYVSGSDAQSDAASSAGSDASGSSSAGSGAETEVTVTWRSGGANVTDSADTQALVSALAAVTLDKCEDYKPSAEAVTLCGFDAPAAAVSAVYRDETGQEQTLTLTIANTTAAGGSRYVRVNDDSTIYSMAEDSLSAFLSVADAGLAA